MWELGKKQETNCWVFYSFLSAKVNSANSIQFAKCDPSKPLASSSKLLWNGFVIQDRGVQLHFKFSREMETKE